TTLVIPFPANAGTSSQVSVDGVTGTLIAQRRGADSPGNHYALIWVKNGIIYGLSGTGSADQASQLANTIQEKPDERRRTKDGRKPFVHRLSSFVRLTE